MTLVLASSSPSRKELLERLRIPFTVMAPDVDETSLPGEQPVDLVCRLARLKAHAVADRFSDALIIASDQVAVLDENIVLGKPMTSEVACAQLRQISGKSVVYWNGLCVLNVADHVEQVVTESTTVVYRHLTEAQIKRYVATGEPLPCAGALRIEGLGITLVERVISEDPTALMGLPLIRLVSMLESTFCP